MSKLIKVYGERNTNTNYISKLISLNLDAREVPGVVPAIILKWQRLLPGQEMVRDIYFYLTYAKNLGWKHTCVKTQEELNKYSLVTNNLAFLTITKNPYSWLLSLYRRPYHQYYSDNPSFESFLQRQWKTTGRDNAGSVLNNPIELWNIKNRSYLSLAEKHTVNTTTECIFEDPESIFDEISHRFDIQRKSANFVDYKKSTKDKNKDGTFYREYYLGEKWRADLTSKAIAIINETIDKKLMSHFGYEVLPSHQA